MLLNDFPATPLPIGSPVPGTAFELEALRGHTTVLVFSTTDWNPSRVEQMTHFYNTLARAATQDGAQSGSFADQLQDMRPDETSYLLHFDGKVKPVTVTVHPTLDSRSDTARAFGVYGQQAVFVVDADGIIRFQSVSQGAMPATSTLVTALHELQPPQPVRPTGKWQATRRDFVASVFAGAIALMFAADAEAVDNPHPRAAQPLQPTPRESPIMLQVNGQAHSLQLDSRVALLDALREHLGLTGSKKGCDHGQCGACTVHLGGERVLSCLTLAAQAQGASITTIEGLAQGDALHPVQEAFIEHDGYQCGYCTPGQIMSAVALLKEGHATTDAEICEGMSGNLCRCAAYPHILASVKAARDTTRV